MTVRRTSNAATLSAHLRELDGVQARIGWFESAKYPDGTPVAYVAAIHEFGTTTIPARPFMRPTLTEKRPAWMKLLENGAREVLRGNQSASAVLELVALKAAGDIRKTIASITSPPLSPITVARKGNSKPLIDTGQMFQSITGVVEPST